MTGGCLCGAVRYEITGKLSRASHCHCSMCRKQHGAAFGTYAEVRRADFRWLSGETEVVRYRSSPEVERGFCRRCGSTLLWDQPGRAESFGIALGTVDGDPGVRASLHLFAGSKAPWYEISDELPRHGTEST